MEMPLERPPYEGSAYRFYEVSMKEEPRSPDVRIWPGTDAVPYAANVGVRRIGDIG
jgi:hypothetical protein